MTSKKVAAETPTTDDTITRMTDANNALKLSSLPRRAPTDATTARNEEVTDIARLYGYDTATPADSTDDQQQSTAGHPTTDESAAGDEAYTQKLIAEGRILGLSTHATSNKMFSNTGPCAKTQGHRFTSLRRNKELAVKSLADKAAKKSAPDSTGEQLHATEY